MRRRTSSQDGQVTVFALGLCLVSIAVAGLAIDGARLWVHKRTLQATADAAAAAGANGLDAASLYARGGMRPKLDPDVARTRAAKVVFQRGLPAAGIEAGAHAVRVSLRSQIDTSFLSLVGIMQIPVTAEAVAEPFFGDA